MDAFRRWQEGSAGREDKIDEAELRKEEII